MTTTVLPAETTAPIPAYVGNPFGLAIKVENGDFRNSSFSAKLVDPSNFRRQLTIVPGTITATEANLSIGVTAQQTEYWQEGDHYLEFSIGTTAYFRSIVNVYGLKSKDSPIAFTEINLTVDANDIAIALTISGILGGGSVGEAVFAAETIQQARTAIRFFVATSLPNTAQLGDIYLIHS
jgi:hypothetical protein